MQSEQRAETRTRARGAEGRDAKQHARDASKERLVVVDAVRALALLGVLVMNLHSMSGLEYLSAAQLQALQGPLDRALDVLLEVLVDKKFLSAFSFLFGLSFTLLLARRNPYEPSFLLMYARRLLGLAAFGLVNIAFFYWGDILLTYAALGALLLVAIRLPGWLVLALAAALTLGTPLALAVLGVTPGVDVQTAANLQALAAFSSPSYLQAMTHGIERYFGLAGSSSLYDNWDNLNIFGLFLLGLWVGRRQIPQDLDAWRPLLRRVALAALPVGLLASLAEVLLPPTSPLATLMLFGTPVLAVGYIASAALFLDRLASTGSSSTQRGSPSLSSRGPAILAAPGRLALTNYLAYGLVGQVVFYGWALGWIGHMGTTEVVIITLVAYGLLLAASHAWLARFKYGPAEWAWRCFTHFSIQPLRRAEPATT